MQLAVTNLVPGRKYRITRPGLNDEHNETLTFTGLSHTVGPHTHARFRYNTGPNMGATTSLRDNNGWQYEANINDEIMARNGALADEHAAFRAQLIEQLGAEEAARRLENPAIRRPLTIHRRGPLVKHYYNTRKKAQNKAKRAQNNAKKNNNTTKGGRRTRRRR